MTYEAWRITFQSSEQAARAAFAQASELAAKIAKLEAELEALWKQEPIAEVTHVDVLPGLLKGKDEGLYRHEFLANFRMGLQCELYARPAPPAAANKSPKGRDQHAEAGG